MSDCIFCKIASGEIPSQTVFEDEKFCVFKDVHPKTPIHLLVIPKEHIVSIADLQPGHAEMISGLIFTAKRIADEQGLPGYKLLFNVGAEGGQTIDHLHLHIMGGRQKQAF